MRQYNYETGNCTAVGTKPMILIIPSLKKMRQNPITIVVIVACIVRYSAFQAIAVSCIIMSL